MFSNLPFLESLGFHPPFQSSFLSVATQGQVPARVSVEHRGQLGVLSASGERLATISGRLRHDAESGATDLPHVGDWVALTPLDDAHGVITHVLPRSTVMWRRMAGHEGKPQILLCNVDTVCVVSALNGDVNPRRLERFLALISEGGIQPVIVLTKTDLCVDLDAQLEVVRSVAGRVPVFCVSALTGDGMSHLSDTLFSSPQSVALLGSSGVGKSTLINHWMGAQVMVEGGIGDDGSGRHTTSHRQLFVRPAGGVLMDTPGVREVGVLAAEGGILSAFPDVEAQAELCRFPDCSHVQEPGCGVRRAVEEGGLDGLRYQSFLKLQRENRHAERRDDPVQQRAAKRGSKVMQRALRAHLKSKRH